jgi:RHS repeat-associated protein
MSHTHRQYTSLTPASQLLYSLIGLGLTASLYSPLSYSQAINGNAVTDRFNQTRTVSFSYDDRGQLINEVTEPDQYPLCQRTQRSYDTVGNLSTTTTSDCAGNGVRSQTQTYDPTGQFLTATTNPLGHTSRISQTDLPYGQKETKSTDPNGLVTTTLYDAQDRKIQSIAPDGSMTRWAYSYCNGGINESNTNSTGLALNDCAVGNDTTIAATRIIQTQYRPDGILIATTDTYYDSLNRPTVQRTTAPDLGQTAGTWLRTITRYDNAGRVSQTAAAHNEQLTPASQIVWTTLQYDLINRPTAQHTYDPQGNSRELGYPTRKTAISYGIRSTRQCNDRNQCTTTETNIQGQTERITDAFGNQIAYQYDAHGNLTKTLQPTGNPQITTDGGNLITTIGYDLRGRKIWMNDPNLGVWTYQYDVFNNLVAQTNAKGQTTTLRYDALNRLTAKSGTDYQHSYTYDCINAIGSRCQTTSSNGYVQTQQYDRLGRLTQRDTIIDNASIPYTQRWTYDNNNRLAAVTNPQGNQLTYSYSTQGHLSQVNYQPVSGNPQILWALQAVDALGQPSQAIHGNNLITRHVRDANQRLIQISHGTAANLGSHHQLNLSYDSLGNLTSKTSPSQATQETYQYDELNRLTQSVMQRSGNANRQWLSYDATGNVTAKIHAQYNADNQQLQGNFSAGMYTYGAQAQNPDGSSTGRTIPNALLATDVDGTGNQYPRIYGYDVQGNLTGSWQTDSNGKTQRASYQWNGRNLPQSVTNLTNSSNSTAVTTQWDYDSDDTRILERSFNRSNQLIRSEIKLHPDNRNGLGLEIIKVPNQADETKQYITSPMGTIGYIKTTNGTTSITYWHTDHLGSISAISDANGTLTESLNYEAFGQRRNADGSPDLANQLSATVTDRGFTGHEHLDDQRLIHMNGRIYDPFLAKFLSPDPYIQSPYNTQSFNRYAYTWNNPLNSIDPTGYISWSDVGRGIRSIVGFGVAPTLAYYILKDMDPKMAPWAILFACGGNAICNAVGQGINAKAHGASGIQSLRTAAIAYGTSQAYDYVGEQTGFHAKDNTAQQMADKFMTPAHLANIAGHAAVGCASASLNGGNCGSGAVGAAVGSFVTPMTAGLGNNPATGFAVTTLSGGVAAKLAGGNFNEGAMQSAMGYLYNFLAYRAPLLNSNNIGADFAYGIDFETGIPRKELGWFAKGLKIIGADIPGLGLLINGEEYTQRARCAVMAECFGSRHLSDEMRKNALSIEPEIKAVAKATAFENGINLKSMSRNQLETIVNSWTKIPGFKDTYGSASDVMNHFKPL